MLVHTLLHGYRGTIIESAREKKTVMKKKYRVVRMVVQVKATITQGGGSPTALVTGDT